jgi:transcriptional regulator with XRE-family HTH domain
MNSQDFRKWLKATGLTQNQAAEALGMSAKAISQYATGNRPDGREVVYPRTVALACTAIYHRFEPWPE